MFEGAEHEWLGNNVWLHFSGGGKSKADATTLRTVKGVNLTFGRVVELAGDFYTSDSYSISLYPDRKSAAFDEAVNHLVSDSGGYLAALNRLLEQEAAAVHRLKEKDGDGTALAYKTHGPGFPSDDSFTNVVGNVKYGSISWMNLDHFGEDAIDAYTTGHKKALHLAWAASHETNRDRQNEKLREAYLNDAFACHYLTDLFSSGHLRVDRRGLHTYDSINQALAVTYDKPVWDLQARIMHDDDSATGLLVRDHTGMPWIAYGDKQLMERHSTINRYRCYRAVQASVDELFAAFSNSASPPNDNARYQAIDLAPRAMPASNAWNNTTYEIYENCAPLWKNDAFGFTTNHQENGPNGVYNTFTRRSDLNDHALIEQVRGQPGVDSSSSDKAPQICIDINNADFKSLEGQFPPTKGIKIVRGGFVQWQILPLYPGFPNHHRSMLNLWAPLSCAFPAGVEKAFSLRYHTEAGDSTGYVVTGPSMHVMAVAASPTQTAIYEFSRNKADQRMLDVGTLWLKTGSGRDVDQTVDELEKYKPEVTKVSYTTNGTRAPVHFADWDPFAQTGSHESANVRFMTATISPTSSATNPDIVTGIQSLGTDSVAVSVFPVESANGHISKLFSQQITGFRHDGTSFLKPYGKGLLVVACGEDQRTKLYELNQQGNLVMKQEHSFGQVAFVHAQENHCVLVGDVMHKGKPQMIVMTSNSFNNGVGPMYNITWRVFENLDQANVNLPSFSFWVTDFPDAEEVKRFFGLAPQDDGKKFLDLFHISSSHQKGNDVIIIRKWTGTDNITYNAGSPLAYQTPSLALGTDCVKSTIPDTINTKKNRQHFVSLRFLRCSVETPVKTDNAIMEVFSLYGIIGCRVFGPTDANKSNYALIGQCPYLGQPALGFGMGTHGEWGCGYLPFGDAWIDEAYWKDQNGKGTWGYNAASASVDLVPGWQVKSMPQWVRG